MDGSNSISVHLNCDGGNPSSVNVPHAGINNHPLGVGAHQSFNSALSSIASALNDQQTPTTTVRENEEQPSTDAHSKSPSILDWARGVMQESLEPHGDSMGGEYASKATLAIEQHEGTGVDRQPFNNDQQIGKID